MKSNTADGQWRDLPGWEGCYAVSNLGEVRSLPRMFIRENGRPFTVKGRILKPQLNSNRRWHVTLHGEGRERLANIATLVLEAWVGPRPPGLVVCHNNGISTDDRLINLRWDTHKSNTEDLIKHGNHFNARKKKCKRGHPFTAENTMIVGSGRRNCRQCLHDRQQARAANVDVEEQRRSARERQKRYRGKFGTLEKPIYTEPCVVCKTEREPSHFKLCEACRERGRAATARYRARLSP